MMINGFSVFMALVLFTIVCFLCSLFLLRTKSHNLWIVALILILCLLRAFIPVEIKGAYTINIWSIYPEIFFFLKKRIVSSLTIGNLISILWFLSSIYLLYKQMCELHRQYKYTTFIALNFPTDARIDAIATKAAKAVNCKQSVRVHIVPDLPSAVMTGFFHPIIVLPKQDMELEDHKIEYILRHEIAHFVGGDTWYKLISQILVCILWWNPVIYLFRRSLEQLLELRSDALACSTLSNVEKGEYTAVLLTVAQRSFKALSTLRPTGFIGIRKSLYFKHRISILLSPKEPKRASWLTALIVCLSIVLYLGSYTFIVQPAALPPDVESPGFYVPTPDTSYLVPIDSGQYEVWVDGVCIATISTEAAKTEPFNQFPIYEKEN